MCVSMSVDAGRVFFVSHIMNVLRHGRSWLDDAPLISCGYGIMNRCIEPLDKRVSPDIDMDSFDAMMDASANVCMMRDATMMGAAYDD